jgi:hypothetical protein
LPYVTPPDRIHAWISESYIGKRVTELIVKIIEDDFVWSSGQADLPQTIPKYSIIQALSGALHVPPVGYLDCIRDGRIEIIQGAVDGLCGNSIEVTTTNGETQLLKADHVISATGYNLVSTSNMLSDLYMYLLTHTRHYHFSPQDFFESSV